MRKQLLKLLAMIAAVTSMACVAQANASGWLWLTGQHPIYIRTNANFIGFQTVEAVQNPANCPDAEFYAVPTAYDSKSALAVLLAANLAGKTVAIFISNTICDTTSGRPVVSDIQMEH